MRRGLMLGVAGLVFAFMAPAITNAAVSPSMHSHPNRGVAGVSYLCGPTTGYSCTPGYSGSNASGWAWSYYGCPKFASGCSAGTPHNCTLYAAFELMQQGVTLNWYANANEWANEAAAHGALVDQVPAVGAIAQWNLVTGEPGHVAVVAASDSGGITIRMDDYYTSSPWPVGYTAEVHIAPGSPAWPDNFIHFKPPDPYAALKVAAMNKIVTVTPTKTSYFYDSSGLHWIPDPATYYCLVAPGRSGVQGACAAGRGCAWFWQAA
jgi:CHAP domain